MSDLMTQHTSELRLVIKMRHNAPCEIDVSTRNSKCVHYVAVQYFELKIQIGAM